jgi:hypothetical protein
MRLRDRLALAVVLLALAALAVWTYAAGDWPASVPEGDARYSDAELAEVLQASVAGGAVRLEALLAHRNALGRYLETIARVSPRNHREQFPDSAEVMAFWLNAHRALALDAALDGAAPPDGSLRAFLTAHLRTRAIGGKRLSLWAIERRLAAMEDPRVWFALNAGARGLPAVAAEPYRGQQLDEELTASARRFLATGANVRVERGTVHLSAFFADHRDAFLSAIRTPSPNLLQLVWAFLPDQCDEAYPGCFTRGDLDYACGRGLDQCPVVFDPVDLRSNLR